MSVRGSGMRKEVYCSSSRALCAQRAGTAGRSRTYVREAPCARGRPAHAQQRSVRVRVSRGYGSGVLTRGQKTIYADAGRVHGRRVVHVKTESYRHRYKLETRRKEGL